VTFTIAQTQEQHTQKHNSLAELWSTFYREYFNAEYPRLIIRFEDTLFHGADVVKAIAHCAGLPPPKKYDFVVDPAKTHGRSSGYVTAMQQYRSEQVRLQGFTTHDLMYAQKTLDKGLRQALHYPSIPNTTLEG
jgi:hypothetical protein